MPATHVVAAVLAAVGAFVTLTCWAISSPPGSSPDEPYHLNSIWCGHGIDEDTCQATDDDSTRIVPHQTNTHGCFAQNTAQSGVCRPADIDDPMTPDTPTPIGNWNGHGYPRVYYFVMSAFVVDQYDASVLTIRVLNGLLVVVLVAALAWLLPRRLKALAPVAFLITAVPLSLFTLASTNPSSWATISAGTMWLALYGAFEARGRRQAALLVFGVVAAVVGAGARTDAALFSAFGVALVLGMRMSLLRSQWRATLVTAFTAVLSLAMYAASGNSSVATSGLGGYDPAPASDAVLFATNALQVPFIWMSIFGAGPMSNLGWFDTPMPWIVGFGSGLVCAALCFQGWASIWWKKCVALVLVAIALMALPLLILQESHIFTGEGVQPRYLLPLVVMFVGISLLPAVGHRLAVNRVQAVVLVALLSVAQSVALYFELLRYVRGFEGPVRSLATYTWWWGGLTPSPMATWLIGSCAFAVTSAIVLSRLVARGDAVATSDAVILVGAEVADDPTPAAVPVNPAPSPTPVTT